MLKSLHKDDTQTTPFVVTKNWELSNVANEDLILMEHSGSDGLPVALEYIDYGIYAPIAVSDCNIALEQQTLDVILFKNGLKVKGIFYPETDPTNLDGTYQRCVYAQVVGMFYNNYRDPTKIWGLEEIDFDNSKTKRFVSDKFKMFEIPQSIFGERVISNTVVLFDTTTDNNYTITDDGRCNLFAGTNLFAHQQELGNFSNNFGSGNSDGCNNYNQMHVTFSYVPDTDVVYWQDVNGSFTGDLAYFNTTVDRPTVIFINMNLNSSVTSLIIGNEFPIITGLICNGNSLTSVDVTDGNSLINLSLVSNQLSSIDVTHNTKLDVLDVSNNPITSLDISKNVLLTQIVCSGTQLTSLDISTNTLLRFVYVDGCQLTQPAVDGILTSLDTNSQSDGNCFIDGGTNAPPSGVGLAATSSLQSKGWTIGVNS